MTEPLALHGGKPAKTKDFPAWPYYDEREEHALMDVLHSRAWWRNVGHQTTALEQEFAALHNVRFALGVMNGTVAIEIALLAAGIGDGDEVLVPALSFISTATAVLAVNATPVFVDVDPHTGCMDLDAASCAVTPRTRAVIPVHLAGHPCDLDALSLLARKHQLLVIEDAAHAQGAAWADQHVGALSTAATFSFQSAKLMTAGEGGMIISQDEAFIERCQLFANCGRLHHDRSYNHSVIGTNARLSEFHAALLRVQLTRLKDQTDARAAGFAQLSARLDIPGVRLLHPDPRVTRHAFYLAMLRFDPQEFGGLSCEGFANALQAEGIPASIPYPPIYHLPVFERQAFAPRQRNTRQLVHQRAPHCPNAEAFVQRTLWLNHRVLLGDGQDLSECIEAIRKIHVAMNGSPVPA